MPPFRRSRSRNCWWGNCVIKTLYFHGDAADQAIRSFESGELTRLSGIDPTGQPTIFNGIVSVLEYSPWTTRYDGRQWRATMRWE
jgi:hypothetical protein